MKKRGRTRPTAGSFLSLLSRPEVRARKPKPKGSRGMEREPIRSPGR